MHLILSILICSILLIYINYILEYFTSQESEQADHLILNKQAKNLVNNYKFEEQFKELNEDRILQRKKINNIVSEAEKVLDFTEMNKDYFEHIYSKYKNQ